MYMYIYINIYIHIYMYVHIYPKKCIYMCHHESIVTDATKFEVELCGCKQATAHAHEVFLHVIEL